jgi:Fe2+ or Zn2+ uptake regulation protein
LQTTKTQFRMTRQREVILEELRKVCTHPSADEIYAMVRQRMPRISLGTVYRNLEILSELGEIRKLESGGCLKRFDGNATSHYHIRCVECGRVFDIHLQPLEGLEKQLDQAQGFVILGHSLEFQALCPDCAQSTKLN